MFLPLSSFSSPPISSSSSSSSSSSTNSSSFEYPSSASSSASPAKSTYPVSVTRPNTTNSRISKSRSAPLSYDYHHTNKRSNTHNTRHPSTQISNPISLQPQNLSLPHSSSKSQDTPSSTFGPTSCYFDLNLYSSNQQPHTKEFSYPPCKYYSVLTSGFIYRYIQEQNHALFPASKLQTAQSPSHHFINWC